MHVTRMKTQMSAKNYAQKADTHKRTLGSVNSAFNTMLPPKMSGFSTKLVKWMSEPVCLSQYP